MKKGGYVYILTNKYNSVLYTGVTADIKKRTYQHKFLKGSLFTHKYNAHKLVYYELFPTINEAIAREKAIKGITRERKIKLINDFNPGWIDLYNKVLDEE